MRILHIETGRHLYGGALQVVYLLKGMRHSAYQNLLLCPAGSRIAEAAAPYAELRAVSVRGDLDPLLPLRIWQTLKSDRPALIHVHSRRGADVWGALLARLCGIPAVITRRVDNPEIGWLARWKYRQYDSVIAISEGIKRVLIAAGVPDAKITCIPSAVDYHTYSRSCRRSWLNTELGLSPTDRLVGMVAQFIPRKGHQLLLEAIPAIAARVPDVKFVLFGQGPLEDQVRQDARNRGLDDRIVMAGFREDLADILPCLELLVHPASMEGLGVSLLQAGAAGIPCVATKAGGIPEIVMHEISGVLIDPGDIGAFEQHVIDLLMNPDKAIRMGTAAQQIVQSQFSIDAMINAYVSQYDMTVSVDGR